MIARIRLGVVLTVALLILMVSAAYTTPIRVLALRSKVLHERRTILVNLPPGYESGSRSYPVLYLTDGESHFDLVSSTADFLAAAGAMPEVIVVGIVNTDRVRDLTPTSVAVRLPDGSQRFPKSGGSQNFRKFIEFELIPSVASRYRTTQFRLLLGHSFGGLFALETLFSRQDLFDYFIAISPSLQWDGQIMVERGASSLGNPRARSTKLFVTIGNESGPIRPAILRFEELLTKLSPNWLTWDRSEFTGEDHNTSVLPGVAAGLKFIFNDWSEAKKNALSAGGDRRAVDLRGIYKRLSDQYGFDVSIPESVFFESGFQLIATGDCNAAIPRFAEWAAAYPKSSRAFASLADAYERCSDYRNAAANYRRAYLLSHKSHGLQMESYKRAWERLQGKKLRA